MENIAVDSETVTISKAEYESMRQQIAWLKEQNELLKLRIQS